MLSKNDLKKIRAMLQEELKASLVRTITIERGPEKQGDPEKVIREEEWNVLDFFAAYAPKIESALRGMQEDVDRVANSVSLQDEKIVLIGQTLLGMETAAKQIASLSDTLKTLGLLAPENKTLEIVHEQSDG